MSPFTFKLPPIKTFYWKDLPPNIKVIVADVYNFSVDGECVVVIGDDFTQTLTVSDTNSLSLTLNLPVGTYDVMLSDGGAFNETRTVEIV